MPCPSRRLVYFSLEHLTPVPTLQPGDYPLHEFHGFPQTNHILSLGLRDTNDPRTLKGNGNDFVIVQTIRGSRKVTPATFTSFARTLKPDILFALPDIPYTQPPYSQKRVTKSIERTQRWLTNTLISQHTAGADTKVIPAIFGHLLGGAAHDARSAFSAGLLEPFDSKTAPSLPHLNNLDEALDGYVLDLIPIRLSLGEFGPGVAPPHPGSESSSTGTPDLPLNIPNRSQYTTLLLSSLDPLPSSKPRLITGVTAPHDILHHIVRTGIDLFDSAWVQHAADWGIALDFTFPATKGSTATKAIGHNLYDEKYALDFSRFANDLKGATELKDDGVLEDPQLLRTCPCAACSPSLVDPAAVTVDQRLPGSEPSSVEFSGSKTHAPPFTRAYLHHLLHTHEMSAHTLLALHNLSVLDLFFVGIRDVLGEDETIGDRFIAEVERFKEIYDEEGWYGPNGILEAGRTAWRNVDLARGKGRFKRERTAGGQAQQAAEVADTEAT
ncbi:tRNA-guanine(15) transglycosylase-like protein [Cantharellus anzutake]|uniref:tRNA-guanine(15) transglycosylase-like protein n=1 Tax=Cantharellus anzutake TaxID=1750568 RepID=UPI0019073BEA|nr:tRNA-guanine(15) transglycosylase-like protein [Cantharellus anzutake]KAF8340490.1 tRNA-guanine(15) transglycosylase-like protein [Cantharellus anzutake]